MSVYQEWIAAKAEEAAARNKRIDAEKAILAEFAWPETKEGTSNFEVDGYKVKITGRISRKVDVDAVRDIAIEHGLEGHLQRLFRWKADINASTWKATDESITGPLLGGIESKPGKPAITIERV